VTACGARRGVTSASASPKGDPQIEGDSPRLENSLTWVPESATRTFATSPPGACNIEARGGAPCSG
jgi:hypothetical protein